MISDISIIDLNETQMCDYSFETEKDSQNAQDGWLIYILYILCILFHSL